MTAPVEAPSPNGVPADVLLAEVVRGDRVESIHVGAVAVAFADGRTWSVGDAARPVWARSAVKPFQALPLLERGAAERLGLGDRELALLSASHDGAPPHVAVVEGLLRRGGLGPEHLLCGPHAPFDRRSSLDVARSGGRPERIHNNCSGKHAGFLLLARDLGAPLDTYLEPDAEGQRLVRQAVAEMADLPPDGVETAVDGCGAPTLRIPLTGLARAFCRLVNSDGLPTVRASSCARLLRAISAQPVMLSGQNRICRALIESAPGRVYPKNGAEGIYAVGVTGLCGVAIKVRDGAERGYLPVIVHLLHRLGLWRQIPPALRDFATVPVTNTQDRAVGAVRCAMEFPTSW